ncbi:MAG: dUTP diphosphatase [Gemmatimonadota bacterium]|nr:dUTP diphosphatase [Gemmatimonadota bacterium]
MTRGSKGDVVFELLHPDARVPERATAGSSGYDLRAHLRCRSVRVRGSAGEETREVGASGALELAAGERALIPLGFKATLPDGIEAQIRLRSSVAFRVGLLIPNAPGTIDPDYPDEWMVMVKNDGAVAVTIRHDERIAQAVLARFEDVAWRAGVVGRTTDRVGGVGSTGA